MAGDLVPLGDATASDIRDLKRPGLLLPIGKHDQMLLVADWDDQMHGLMLTGDHAFIYFPVNIRNPHEGLFVPEPEILIDFASATNGVGHEHDEGVLLLEKGKLSVVATPAGDRFGTPQKVPLWTKVGGGSDAAKIAFTRWGVGVRDGDGFRTLWEWEKLPKGAVVFSD